MAPAWSGQSTGGSGYRRPRESGVVVHHHRPRRTIPIRVTRIIRSLQRPTRPPRRETPPSRRRRIRNTLLRRWVPTHAGRSKIETAPIAGLRAATSDGRFSSYGTGLASTLSPRSSTSSFDDGLEIGGDYVHHAPGRGLEDWIGMRTLARPCRSRGWRDRDRV